MSHSPVVRSTRDRLGAWLQGICFGHAGVLLLAALASQRTKRLFARGVRAHGTDGFAAARERFVEARRVLLGLSFLGLLLAIAVMVVLVIWTVRRSRREEAGASFWTALWPDRALGIWWWALAGGGYALFYVASQFFDLGLRTRTLNMGYDLISAAWAMAAAGSICGALYVRDRARAGR